MDNLEKAIRALILINLRAIEQPEQVMILSAAGYKPAEIGEMLDIKANTAAKTLQRAKRGNPGGEKAKAK
jgi:DNA-directed RNA polymerase specialized sigma24 family protein